MAFCVGQRPKNAVFLLENPGISRKNPDLKSGGSGGPFLARKLHRIILLHFGLVAFRIHFPKPQVIIFMFFGLGGRVHDSQKPILFHLWRHQETPNNSRKNPDSLFQKIILGNLKTVEIENVGNYRKHGAEHPEDPSTIVSKSLNMGSISSGRHGMEF